MTHSWEDLANMELEEQAQKVIAWTQDTLDRVCPLQQSRPKNTLTVKPSKQLRILRRARDNARSKKDMKTFKCLRNKAVTLARKETQDQNSERIRKNPMEVWKILKGLQGNQDKEESNIEVHDAELSGRDAAVAFSAFFPQKIKQLREKLPQATASTTLNPTNQRARSLGLCSNGIDFAAVEEKTVLRIIQNFKPSKATDVYGVSPYILKLIAPVLSAPLTLIVNNSLLDAKVPECWKKAKILPIHKKKSKKLVSNYRPVSILTTFSKVLEAVVKEQLSTQFETLGIIPNTQHGFRPECSTVSAVMMFEHDLRTGLHGGKRAGALFLDLSAAFDLVDPTHLVPKLQKYGATKTVQAWITSYLSGRKQQVYYQGEESEERNSEVGAPQGSVLSPFLFLVLVSDMEEAIGGLDGVSILSYADDTTVYVIADTEEEVIAKLEAAAVKLLQFMSDSGLAANPEKTHFLMFGRKKGRTNIQVGEAIIEESSSEQLVGFTVSSSLSWKEHCENLERVLRGRVGILRRLSWHLPRNILLQCLNPIFNSKLMYGLEVITNPATYLGQPQCKAIAKLQVIQNEAMRAVLGLRLTDRTKVEVLLQKCNQLSVHELALRATMGLAWNSLSSCARRKKIVAEERLRNWQMVRETRQSSQQTFPVQEVKSLLSRLTIVWNNMPEDIRSEEQSSAAKKKIKSCFSRK